MPISQMKKIEVVTEHVADLGCQSKQCGSAGYALNSYITLPLIFVTLFILVSLQIL